MKISNNTSYNITLTNGSVIKGYGSLEIYKPNSDLVKQIKNLERDGILTVS